MTTTQQQTIFSAEIAIKQTSIFVQKNTLQSLADQYKHPRMLGRLTCANIVADACGVSIQRANNIFRYCAELEEFFIEVELLMIEESLLAEKRPPNKNGRMRLRDLSDDELIRLAGHYHNVKDLSERNDSLRKQITKRGLMNEVRLCHPSYTTSQAYIGLDKSLIVKSVYELIFANILTYAKIAFDYNVDSGIQKKTKNYTIDFEVFFGEQSVLVELAQNLYVDNTCKLSRRNEYAVNIQSKRDAYLQNFPNEMVYFIDTDIPYKAFYNDIVQWLNHFAPLADIASFSQAMVKQNESLKYLLDESVESVAFRIIDEYKGLEHFKNKHSSTHTYLKQSQADEYEEIMQLAKKMSNKLRTHKSHITRYNWSKPAYFTFNNFLSSAARFTFS
tara:strand:- start:1857 stop:3023 length:1167 start_codon:yes stop_codon:yes gene_type:complete